MAAAARRKLLTAAGESGVASFGMGGFCRMAPRQNQAWARLFPSKPSQFLRLSNYDTATNPTCIPFAVFQPKRRPILLNDFPAEIGRAQTELQSLMPLSY